MSRSLPVDASMRRAVTLGLAAAALVSCARPQTPPGGEEDRAPPRVASVSPEPTTVVDAWDGPVVIRFDERISEQRVAEAVMVSPETGAVELDRAGWGSRLEVSLEGGWRPDRIYRIVILPVIQDLFGNSREEPIELVFSTGPEIPRSALLGDVSDRLTADAVDQARVEAIAEGDSIPYVAVTDADGLFVHRSLPPGRYRVRAYEDRDRSGRAEAFEPQDSGRVTVGAEDTVFTSLQLLLPDSTPARLAQAEPRDSASVRLTFDDAFDPDAALDDVAVTLERLPDSAAVDARLMHTHAYEALLRERRDSAAAADSIAADSIAADTAAAEAVDADTAAAAPPDADSTEQRERAGRTGPPDPADQTEQTDRTDQTGRSDPPDQPPLPARELILVPDTPLEPEVEYRVELNDLTNIAGVPGGGGSDTFRAPAPAPPPPPDSTATGEAADSTAGEPEPASAQEPGLEPGLEPEPSAVPDTVSPDSAAVPDTTALRRETRGARSREGVRP